MLQIFPELELMSVAWNFSLILKSIYEVRTRQACFLFKDIIHNVIVRTF
jgi:hypothetical protein